MKHEKKNVCRAAVLFIYSFFFEYLPLDRRIAFLIPFFGITAV